MSEDTKIEATDPTDRSFPFGKFTPRLTKRPLDLKRGDIILQNEEFPYVVHHVEGYDPNTVVYVFGVKDFYSYQTKFPVRHVFHIDEELLQISAASRVYVRPWSTVTTRSQ